jgi:kumamolisin
MADSIQLTLVLRPPAASKAISERLMAGTYDPAQTKPSDTAADPADVEAVKDFAANHDLQIAKIDAAARSVRLTGSAADIEKAFGIRSGDVSHGSVQTLNYKGSINLPGPLNQIVIAVLGLDHTPIARPRV